MQHLRRTAARVPAPAAVILPAAATTTPTPSKPPLGHPADRNENHAQGRFPLRGAVFLRVTDGLFARIIGKISALTVAQYINYLNNQPIGRVKYALV